MAMSKIISFRLININDDYFHFCTSLAKNKSCCSQTSERLPIPAEIFEFETKN